MEEIFLEKYFLEPGSAGAIGSIYVDDEELIDILGADDLADLQRAFVSILPHITTMRSYLGGDFRPIPGQNPDYLRILIFVCWMQTSKTRKRGDRDFREMLARHTGHRFLGASMRGLNPMWEHLQAYLSKEHGIELDLPAIYPHSQIGRTLRIAFPTWRDKVVFRRLRQGLGQARLLDPLEVSRALYTSRRLLTDTMPSFGYNFGLFDRSWKRGGRDYMKTPFWQAWYSVVAERTALEELEIVKGDFGDHEIFRVSPSGERRPLRDPEEASKFVPEPIAKAIRGGAVLMEDLGFGRSRATSSMESNLFLMHRSRLAECDEGAVVSYDNVNAQWILANFRSSTASDAPVKSGRREIGWRDGIRVGGAYLGRSPFTPILSLPADIAAKISMGGEEIAMETVPNGLAFPRGHYSGVATAQAGGQLHSILLVPKATEVPEIRRLSFDRSRDIGEDQFHRETAPSSDAVLGIWPGERVETCGAMTDISEALYARTARGLAFVEALEIIRRGLPHAGFCPREWDILRTFADAGWFDLTLLRNFPARKLLQRPVTIRTIGVTTVAINGPTPLALIEHIEAAAEAAGATVEVHHGISEWSLPRLLVRTDDQTRQRDFIDRIGYAEQGRRAKAEPRKGEQNDAHGYHVVARFDDHRGCFATSSDGDMPHGLYRLERNEGKRPFLYRSVVAGMQTENFVSPSIAILAHHARMHRQLFRYDGKVLVASASRASLPSSWAQWASDRTACNAGVMLRSGKWIYAYPLGPEEVALLSGLVSIERNDTRGFPWIDRFTASASNRDRVVYDCRSGKTRGAHPALWKRS